MTKRCDITGKGPMSGNNVSHANNRTKRRFLTNLQKTSFYSEGLGLAIPVRASARGIRTVEHKGGIDAFLLGKALTKLQPALRKWRKLLLAKVGELEKPEPKTRRWKPSKRAVKKAEKKKAA